MLVVAPSWLSWPLKILHHFTWSIGSLKPSGRANPLDPVWAQLGDRQSRCAGNNWLVETYTTRGPGGLCKNPVEAQRFFFSVGGNDWRKWNIPFQDDLWLNGNGLGSPHYYICSCCFLGPCWVLWGGWVVSVVSLFEWPSFRIKDLFSVNWMQDDDLGKWPVVLMDWYLRSWESWSVRFWNWWLQAVLSSLSWYTLGALITYDLWPFYRGFDLWMNSKQGTPLRLSNLRLARLPSWPTKAPWIWFQGWRSWPATKREYSSPGGWRQPKTQSVSVKKECAKSEKLLRRSTVLLCICIYQ